MVIPRSWSIRHIRVVHSTSQPKDVHPRESERLAGAVFLILNQLGPLPADEAGIAIGSLRKRKQKKVDEEK